MTTTTSATSAPEPLPGTPVGQHVRRLLSAGYPLQAVIKIIGPSEYQGKHRAAE